MNSYADGNISILRLIRYDRAVDQCYVAQLIAIVLGIFLHYFPEPGSLMAWGSFGGRILPFDLLYLLALSYFVFILVMTGVRTKSSMMCMTMPLSTRRVWLSRILSILFVSQLPIILVTLITAFRGGGTGEPFFLDGFTLRLGFHTCAAIAMLLMLLQLPMLELRRFTKTGIYVAYAGFFSAAVIFAAMVTVGITLASWLFLFGAAGLALWILIHLPASFSTMPAEPDLEGAVDTGRFHGESAAPTDSESTSTFAVSPAMTRTRMYLTIARIVVNRWNYWTDCLLLIFYAMMAVISYYEGTRENPWWLFGFIWVYAALMQSIQMLKKVDFLPVSRKLIFGMTMTPIIFVIFLGMGIGVISVAVQQDGNRLMTFSGGRLQVPKEFYEMTEDGPPPVITSIWSEFHEPEAHPLFAGSPRYIYNPFDTGPESSPRFIALQIDRAIEAIYGIERNPLEKYEDFTADIESCCLKVEKMAGRNSDTRSRVFALAGIITAAIYSVIISLQIGYGGKHGGKHIGNLIVPGAVILVILIIGSVVVAGRAGLCNPSFVEAVPSIYMRRAADAIPLSTATLWTLFVAVCVAGYFMLQSAYCRFEAPMVRAGGRKSIQ